MAWPKSASEVAVGEGMIQVIVRIVRAAVVSHPVVARVDVWGIGMAGLIAEITIRRGRRLLGPMIGLGQAIPGRRVLRSCVLWCSSARGWSRSARRDPAAVEAGAGAAAFTLALLSAFILRRCRQAEKQSNCERYMKSSHSFLRGTEYSAGSFTDG
jgi:hypothetical protein